MKQVLEIEGFEDFNPVQKQAIEKGLFDKSLLVVTPTASGKTLAAFLASINAIQHGKKVVFTCPLKALASEHFNDFKKKYSVLGMKPAISTGDFDSSSSYLSKYDLIFCTNEKLISLINHKAEWINQVGLLVIDEVHEIDSDRGPVIEMLVTMLKQMNPGMQLLALSATVPNSVELGEWLEAELVESNYRPVPLKEGVYFDETLYFNESLSSKEKIKHEMDALHSLLSNTLDKNKQALVFCDTRKRAEQLAEKISCFIEKKLSEKEKNDLKKISLKALSALEKPTEQCALLSKTIAKGIAFHHAGLVQRQRGLIEESFKEGKIKVLTATPTLAAGINVPAFRVIIPYLYRFGGFGSERISVRSYKQMAGRSGRPKYDACGESVLIARNESEINGLFNEFINAELEEVNSRLGLEPVLRTYLLSLIANNFVFDLASLESFFSKTFYAKQFNDLHELFIKLKDLLLELRDMNFIEVNEKGFKATMLGRRVSELFLDPLTADAMIKALKSRPRTSDLAYLFMICDSFELFPYLPIPKRIEAEVFSEFNEMQRELLVEENKMYLDTQYLNKFFLAKAFNEWINEQSDEFFLKDFNVQPGIMRSRLERADWLLYASSELARLLELNRHMPGLAKLRMRMKYGIREELLSLVQLKYIGRVRARLLFNKGIKTVNDLKKTGLQELAGLLPPKIALHVMQQIGLNKEVKPSSLDGLVSKQKKLN